MGFLNKLLSRSSPGERLWAWVAENEALLVQHCERGEPLPEAEQEELNEHLQAVAPELRLHVVPQTMQHSWQLVLSVGGAPHRLAMVKELAAIAPELESFEVVAFAPPIALEYMDNEALGVRLYATNMTFRIEVDELPRVLIFVPQVLETQGLRELVYHFLYQYMGEYAYGMLHDYVDVWPMENSNPEGQQPLSELRKGLVPILVAMDGSS